MKTIFNRSENELRRVKDYEAERMVQTSEWAYVPKSEFKKLAKKEEKEVKEEKKNSKKTNKK